MERFPIDADDRDGQVAEVTEQLVRDWARLLVAGETRAIRNLHNTVLERLTEADAAAVFVQAVTDDAGAAERFCQLAVEAMRAECEAAAERAVADMEHARVESQNQAAIARATAHLERA